MTLPNPSQNPSQNVISRPLAFARRCQANNATRRQIPRPFRPPHIAGINSGVLRLPFIDARGLVDFKKIVRKSIKHSTQPSGENNPQVKQRFFHLRQPLQVFQHPGRLPSVQNMTEVAPGYPQVDGNILVAQSFEHDLGPKLSEMTTISAVLFAYLVAIISHAKNSSIKRLLCQHINRIK